MEKKLKTYLLINVSFLSLIAMPHLDDSVMAPLIEDNATPFRVEPGNGYALPHPVVTFFHLAFRGAALFFYIMCSWFSDSFITSFIIVVLLLSLDFWTVKNVTGRIMVGLRWWNYIDDNGVSHWVYESKKEPERSMMISGTESKIFWAGLFVFPFFWGLMFVAAFFSLKFKWLVLVIIALALNGSNVYGYLKCKFGKSDKSIHETLTSVTSGFLRDQVVQNVLNSAMNSPQSVPSQQNPPHNIV